MSVRKIRCEKCENLFEDEVFESVDVTSNKELRGMVIRGDIYNHRCPKCDYINKVYAPLMYSDHTNKFVILSAPYPDQIIFEDEIKNGELKPLNEEGYRFQGVCQPYELASMIYVFEEEFSPKAFELYKLAVINEFESATNKTVRICVVGMNSGELSFILELETNEYYCIPISRTTDIYNEILDSTASLFEGTNDLVFNMSSARKILSMDIDETRIARETELEMALVEMSSGAAIAIVPSFIKGSFLPGDHVCLAQWIKEELKYVFHQGVIEEIIHTTDYKYPYDVDDTMNVVYKTGELSITSSKESNAEISNRALLFGLTQYLENNREKEYFPYNIYDSCDVILPVVVSVSEPGKLEEAMNGSGSIDASDVGYQSKIMTVVDGGKEYMAVYLSQDAVGVDAASRFVYRMSDVMKVFFNKPGSYDGIIVNPDTDRIVLDEFELINYELNKIMINTDLFAELLNMLSDEEIEYIGRKRYDLIRRVYFEYVTSDDLKNEGYSDDELKDLLGYGYSLIKRVLLTKFL